MEDSPAIEVKRYGELMELARQGNPNPDWLVGVEVGRSRMLREIYLRVVDGDHEKECHCDACAVVEAVSLGREAFFIADQTSVLASRTRRRQDTLKDGYEMQVGKSPGNDPDCKRCSGDPAACFADTINWRICPHTM
jgi:hypothetical protein